MASKRSPVPKTARWGFLLAAVLTWLHATPAQTAANPAPSVPRPWPDTSAGIHVFHDQIELSTLSGAQIRFAATHYAGVQKISAADAATLRGISPGFLVLHYRLGYGLGYQAASSGCAPNGHYIQIRLGNRWVQEWPGDGSVQPQWFFHYRDSPRVYFCPYGWYVMDVGNAGYRNWWLSQVRAQLMANGDDGIFLDSFSIPNFFGSDSFRPQLPATDARFEASWAATMQSWLAWLKGELPNYYLVPNVGQWTNDRDRPELIEPADGIMVEQFALPNDTDAYPLRDWRLQMDRVLSSVARNQAVIAQTYATSARNRMFTLGSYLLIKGARTYMSINNLLSVEWYPEYDVPIGAPTQSATANSIQALLDRSGLYRRNFTHGFVLVNPGTTARSEALGRSYFLAQTSPDGILTVQTDGAVRGRLTYSAVNSIELPAHSAAVLLESASRTP